MNKKIIYTSAGEYQSIRGIIDSFQTRSLDDIMPKPLATYRGYIETVLSTVRRCLEISGKLNKYPDVSLHIDSNDIQRCREIARICTRELVKIDTKKKHNDILIRKIYTNLRKMKKILDSPYWLKP